MADTLLELREITKHFPGVSANDHVSFDLRGGESARPGRGERRGQDHPHEDPLRPVPSRTRAPSPCDGAAVSIRGPRDAISPGHRHGPPALHALRALHRAGKHHHRGRSAPGRRPFHARAARSRAGHHGRERDQRTAGRPRRGARRGPPAARGDPEDPLPRRADPHLRRAHRRAHTAGIERAVPHIPRAHRARQGRDLHHPQAGRGAGSRGPDHRDPPGEDRAAPWTARASRSRRSRS